MVKEPDVDTWRKFSNAINSGTKIYGLISIGLF